MSRIIYSCCANGRGHKIQSRVIAELLRVKGHEVRLIEDLPTLPTPVENNILDISKVIMPEIPIEYQNKFYASVAEFKPDLAISDFDPFLPVVAHHQCIPAISVSSQPMILAPDFDAPFAIPDDYLGWVKSTVANVRERVIPTYAKGKDFIGPIIKPSLIGRPITNDGHILVYQTNNWPDLRKFLLTKFPRQVFKFYGFGQPGEVDQFDADLLSCLGVLTNGGHNLISAAAFLGKPVLSMPVVNHTEQEINADRMVWEELGWQTTAENLGANLAYFLMMDWGYNPRIIQAGNDAVIAQIEANLK